MANAFENEVGEGAEGGGETLRIDRWLWCTRLFKTRSLAAESVSGGKVHLNGVRVKPSRTLKVGDHVQITRPGFQFECEVLKLADRRGSATVAQSCYAETDAARAAREKHAANAKLAAAFSPPPSLERPDKHGRRELRRLRGRD
ncbi:MAG: RNA-binding S4 domain-containing protein [Pseudomonadota bacterium]